MHVFLTGATGFIGSHVARALIARGHHVRCLRRSAAGRPEAEDLGVEWRVGDLTDRASIRRAADGAEVIFHCAADYRLYAPDPVELYRNNVGGTRNVLAVAAELGVQRVVYTSSVGTLAVHGREPANENARATANEVVGDYKRSKLLAEREAERWNARGLPVVVVSPSTPIGECDVKPTPTGRMVVDFLNGRMPAYVDTGLNVVDVHDVAAGHVLAAERGRPGETYILGHVNLTLREILELLAGLTGRPAPRIKLPHWVPLAVAHLERPLARWLRRPPRIPVDAARMSRSFMFFDVGKAVRELGMPQSPPEAAFERAVRWFVDHRYARPAAAR